MPDHAALSRRRLLASSGIGLLALLGCGEPVLPDPFGRAPYERAACVPRDSLDAHRSLAGLRLVYEPSGQGSAFWFEPAFFGRLESWAQGLEAVLDGAPSELRTYGSWTDGGSNCDSWHNAGRAFDLARVRLAGGAYVSCRYDTWRSAEPPALARNLRAYWRLAASLHLDFAYVLTYLYDAEHANHIHVDNGRSGAGGSTFSARSRVQVQAVQAICRHVWAEPVEISGSWDGPTRTASRRVLDRIGAGGALDGSAVAWTAFLTASAVREP